MTKKKYPLRWAYPEDPKTRKEGLDMFVICLHDHIARGFTWGGHGKLSGDARGLRGDVTKLRGRVEYYLTGWVGNYDKILEGDVTGLTGDIEQYIDPDSDDGRGEVLDYLTSKVITDLFASKDDEE